MKLMIMLSIALLGVVPAPVDVPLRAGIFQRWAPPHGPTAFVSGGARVTIAPVPCNAASGSESCTIDGWNDQPALQVTAGALPRFRYKPAGGSHYRIAIARIRASDAVPGVIVESQSGGSSGDEIVQVLVPDRRGFRAVTLTYRALDGSQTTHVEGQLRDHPADLNGDGTLDFVLFDGKFDSAFGCNACTPRPPLVLTIRGGSSADVSRETRFAPIFRSHMAQMARTCLSLEPDRNGACAAYVADAAVLGNFAAGWAQMLRHYDREDPAGADFPARLRVFLRKAGYIA